ncbi:MAG: CO dehydrogenase/acetyl-CoA synthase complex subunit alpha, partial [Candidatus Bathyarchaeia archaeon]
LMKYKPFYMPFCELCCLCTMGKCDLSGGKKGACGIRMDSQQSRIVLLACSIGAATHTGHARHLLHHLLETYGPDHPIDVGGVGVQVEAPVTRLVCGIRPRKLGDLEDALDYVEREITHLLASTHTGNESNSTDFESKVFHAGMIDHVAMEVADIAQIATYGFPKADPDAPLVEGGFGSVDSSKPVILVIGHNVIPSVDIVDYLDEHGFRDKIEVCGICCSAHDMTRYSPKAKIVGPLSWQLRFIRSGIPDVVVVDEQCVRTDTLEEAKRLKAPLIATNAKNCSGLDDRTADSTDSIIADLSSYRIPGALILDSSKIGEVAVKTAFKVAPLRREYKRLPEAEEVIAGSQRCRSCQECMRACPNTLDLVTAINGAGKGDLETLAQLLEECIGCGRCESACPERIPIHHYMAAASKNRLSEEKFRIRSGRGPIQDVEIREVGRPIVFGEIPGVVALVGCTNYAKGGREVAEIAEEFANRQFIVVASGCAAMSLAFAKDSEGKTLYEKYTGRFEAGGIVNVGSCVANSHISGAAIKIANIFAKRSLRANYEEIADYIHNRVGAVGVAWGAMSQKAASIAAGFWRLGVPVIVGPQGSKYRRMLLGDKEDEERWKVYDARTGEAVYAGPTPEHLFYAAENKEEAITMIAKLSMRPNDTTKGRAIKISHYVDLHKRLYGRPPPDVHYYVRTKADIPLTMKEDIEQVLKEKGWKETTIPDPTLLERMIRQRKG